MEQLVVQDFKVPRVIREAQDLRDQQDNPGTTAQQEQQAL